MAMLQVVPSYLVFPYVTDNMGYIFAKLRDTYIYFLISDMSIIVDVEPEEYMEKDREAGIFMVIHDESSMPDIHTDGLNLIPGHSYHIGVQKVKTIIIFCLFSLFVRCKLIFRKLSLSFS